jgi:DUF1680 family protein
MHKISRRDALKLMLAGTGGLALTSSAACGFASEISNPDAHGAAFEFLAFGEVKPAGWIKAQMDRDLNHGFAGCLDRLCKEASSDIFVSGRNSVHSQNTQNHDGVAWWNGETEGNWRAGFFMMSYLTENPEFMRQADAYVQHILSSQDANGYLGAFAPEMQYQHPGDLWTQACLLRGLLAYSELANRPDVFQAVQRSANLTVATLGPGGKPIPWGEDHDLMITDVMESLATRTGDKRYRDFSLFHYDSWSRQFPAADMSLPSLLTPDKPFVQHGVHVYESIRVPLWLASETGRDDLVRGAAGALNKLGRYTETGGSAVSEEMVAALPPNPTTTEYEYCASKEVQMTLQSALQKSGNAPLGDCVERVWLNDAQGARLADGTAISYLSSDNRPTCDGRSVDGKRAEPRNKFSPTHADVAVCCNPNATNVAALFVRGMWMRHRSGALAAMHYGPCKVSTRISGVPVTLEEDTNYPFSNEVEIRIQPAQPAQFPLLLRDPDWSSSTTVTCAGAAISREGGYWRVTKRWTHGDRLSVRFTPSIREVRAENGEITLQYGSLLFARPLPAASSTVRDYPLPGFEDTYYVPGADTPPDLLFRSADRSNGYGFRPAIEPGGDSNNPFGTPPTVLKGTMLRSSDHQPVNVTLVPLGNAPLLRRLTHASDSIS